MRNMVCKSNIDETAKDEPIVDSDATQNDGEYDALAHQEKMNQLLDMMVPVAARYHVSREDVLFLVMAAIDAQDICAFENALLKEDRYNLFDLLDYSGRLKFMTEVWRQYNNLGMVSVPG